MGFERREAYLGMGRGELGRERGFWGFSFFAARAQNRMNSLLRCIQQIFAWPLLVGGSYLLLPGEMSVRA